jgi:hypothetical protein
MNHFFFGNLVFPLHHGFHKKDVGINADDRDQSRKMMKHYRGFMSGLCGILMFGGK